MIQINQLFSGATKKTYMNAAYACAAFAALVLAGWFALRTYRSYQGKKAQLILSESLHDYQTTMNSYKPQWAEVQLMNELGVQQVSGSGLQPYFVVMQAQALAQQKNYEAAVELMQKAIDAVPADLPFASYYMLTKHLMQLDVPTQKEAGFASLQALSQDEAYRYRDAALFHVGDYYYAMQDIAQAKAVWHNLVAQAAVFAGSPWVMLAQQKLATI